MLRRDVIGGLARLKRRHRVRSAARELSECYRSELRMGAGERSKTQERSSPTNVCPRRFQSGFDGEKTKMQKTQPTRASEVHRRPDLAQLMSEVFALRERARVLEAVLEVEMSRGAAPSRERKRKEPSQSPGRGAEFLQ